MKQVENSKIRKAVDLYEDEILTLDRNITYSESDQTKKDQLRHIQKTGKIPSLGKVIGNKIINYMQLAGMDKDLPSNKYERVAFIMRFHCYFCLLNPFFPPSVPLILVYRLFFQDVICAKVIVKGHNVSAHNQAFRDWLFVNKDKFERRCKEPSFLLTEKGSKSPATALKEAEACLGTLIEMGAPERVISVQQERIKRLLSCVTPIAVCNNI